jgi:GT2 family glycosyltransferase
MGWRLRLKGYDITREPRSKVLHFGTKSVKDWGTKKLFGHLSERHRLSNFFLFYEFGNVMKLAPLYIAVDAVKLLGLAAKRPWKAWAKMRAYLWFIKNAKKLWKKRILIQEQRKVGDRDVTCMMSSRLFPDRVPLSSEMNRLSRRYCSLMGIRTVESS